MAIISKPEITRGVEALITLNRIDLLAHASVVADGYFSSESNWSKIVLNFRSNSRDQIESVVFDSNDEGKFFVSSRSVGDFLIHSLEIFDFDGGVKTIRRSELNTVDFDVIFGA